MYDSGTVLKLKEPKFIDSEGKARPLAEFKPKDKNDKPALFPYNEVTVLGASPIGHAQPSGAEWTGVDAQGVIVQPLTVFSVTLDEPLGKIQRLYEVVSVPEKGPAEIVVKQTTTKYTPTPEELLNAERDPNAEKSKDGQRVKTPYGSPLDEIDEPPTSSPLGN